MVRTPAPLAMVNASVRSAASRSSSSLPNQRAKSRVNQSKSHVMPSSQSIHWNGHSGDEWSVANSRLGSAECAGQDETRIAPIQQHDAHVAQHSERGNQYREIDAFPGAGGPNHELMAHSANVRGHVEGLAT